MLLLLLLLPKKPGIFLRCISLLGAGYGPTVIVHAASDLPPSLGKDLPCRIPIHGRRFQLHVPRCLITSGICRVTQLMDLLHAIEF